MTESGFIEKDAPASGAQLSGIEKETGPLYEFFLMNCAYQASYAAFGVGPVPSALNPSHIHHCMKVQSNIPMSVLKCNVSRRMRGR